MLVAADDQPAAADDQPAAAAVAVQRAPRKRKWGTTRTARKSSINVSAETLKVSIVNQYLQPLQVSYRGVSESLKDYV